MHANPSRTVAATACGCAFLLVACGGGSGDSSGGSTPPVSARAVPQTDAQIAALLYSDSARTPPGFHADSGAPVAGYVTTSHLKNTDLAPAATQHELCSDDWNDALAWSETAAGNVAPYADLVATDSNSRFFEFGRVPRGQADTYQRARVYRCTYLDRGSVDLLAGSANAGQLNRRPLTAADLRELSEYLWRFTSFNNFGNVVLLSSGVTGAARLIHTLHIAQLHEAAAGGCDRIDVLAWSHSAESSNGALQRVQQPSWTFGARQVSGGVELCTP